ncbi:carboxylesterase [Alicyclobacillus tengchongensis]|uniref:Carboxylic ester hydrolase n=1 Tax=Alicyclobacillus sp. D-1 TaxID=1132418 RepID=H2ESD6_9BACL|nr:carboxylesterase [Alicyclobacillus sp. D-1]KRW91333.1 carboxylesterase [Alicyclobacillus tengchongensis]
MNVNLNRVADAPVVSTRYGKVQGIWQDGGSAAYLGIPYAAPPVGKLRFFPPHPPEPWEGIRTAAEYGPTPQRRPFGDVTTIPEPSIPGDDVLNLNVFTPAPRDRLAKLPVLVWIHGGGYFAGSPASPWYNGRSFNHHGVVFVTLSYRLGFDGFGWMEGAPLNRGLLDQIAALRWVKDNIREFGGDPDRVTIAGQSAGGGSVLSLLASPKADGLFQSAIAVSSAFGWPTANDVAEVGRGMAEHFGIDPTIEAWRTIPHERILDVEREWNHLPGSPSSASVDELLTAMRTGLDRATGLAFRPVLDGDVLVHALDHPTTQQRIAHIPIIIGSTRNEFSFPSLADAPGLDEICEILARHGVADAAIERFAHDTWRIGEERALGQFMTSFMFRNGIARFAELRNRAGAGTRTWLYDFAELAANAQGSFHCLDLPYFFDQLDAPNVDKVLGPNPSQPLADAMHGTWVEFLKHGRLPYPSTEDNPCGAIHFQGGAEFRPDAYFFERELLAAVGQWPGLRG